MREMSWLKLTVVNDGDMYLWRELGVNSWLIFAVVGPNGRLLAQHLEKDNDPRLFTSPLKFPGKLAVDVENNRLFISDSNHIRILLNSPWDVCFHLVNEKVYIAMAGQHQIWQLDTADGITRAFSGDGYERNLNGSR
ncbi:putative transcription factor WD40-like family [Rosa chinensis]|uniref:Putative transcription factor WD40-like family n=1 Tax=Rosa chinensis TaxID=74649 RepID=A0A2P6QQY1_ROSCH|nr:putative transcription factor WD40-like family [Rosa chinensis]